MTASLQEALFQSVLESAPDAIIILGADGLIEIVNAQAEKLFGYGRDELVGHEVEILVPERLRAGHPDLRNGFRGHPTTRPMGTGLELLGRRKDGNEFPVEISLSPTTAEVDRRVVCAVRDVTLQKQAQEQLRRMLEERLVRDEAMIENLRALVIEAGEAADDLRASNAAKDEFVSMISHELMGPLTIVLGNARLLMTKRDRSEEAQLQALKDIEQGGRRLQTTIEDLMALVRPESAEAVANEPISLRAIAASLIQQHSQQFPDRPIRTGIESELIAAGHPEYLVQILSNLIGNAEKYSAPNEPIEIEARVLADGATIEVSVLDRGSGVKKEEAEAIFNSFYRARTTMGMASGMGIGLSVCKRLIERQGGRIWVEERSGGGSAFRFVLPKY